VPTEQYGLPAARILRFLDRLAAEHVCMHGFILSHHGATVAEGYWQPFLAALPHRMFSVSRSMTSLAIGILVQKGFLCLEDRITAFFPEKLSIQVPGPLQRLTLRDMLRMATCHAVTTYRPAVDDEWARTFFTVPPTHEPGTVFAYDTSASQVLAALVEKLAGMPILDFLQQNLFNFIGATGPKRWLRDPSGTSQGGTGLLMTLRDLDKAAGFCMGDGSGIIPTEYLRAATGMQIETPMRDNPEECYGYGYQFWRTRNGFSMYGLGGQMAICVPDKQLSLCTTADTQLDPYGVQRIYDAFFEELEPYVTENMLLEDEESNLALAKRLDGLTLPVLPNDPTFAWEARGLYRIASGSVGWTALELEPGVLSLYHGTACKRIAFGVGNMVHGYFPGSQEPCIASAGWFAPGSLRIRCHIIGDMPCGVDLLLVFAGKSVTIQQKRVHDLITEGKTNGISRLPRD